MGVAIKHKDRKIRWGRSGGRCALCRRPLVEAATATDSESVVGDEAHIAARSPGGPRFGQCAPDEVDSHANLILLCKVDHKKVDDQPGHYTSPVLQALKAAHENWVIGEKRGPDLLRKAKELGLFPLSPLRSGDDVWNVIDGASRYLFDDLGFTVLDGRRRGILRLGEGPGLTITDAVLIVLPPGDLRADTLRWAVPGDEV